MFLYSLIQYNFKQGQKSLTFATSLYLPFCVHFNSALCAFNFNTGPLCRSAEGMYSREGNLISSSWCVTNVTIPYYPLNFFCRLPWVSAINVDDIRNVFPLDNMTCSV